MNGPEPRRLGRLAVDEVHFRLIREHGGAHGLRDENALESALARPRNRWHDQPGTSLQELAAAYAHALARSHPYVDGNKRVALVVMVAFLDLNGVELTATNEQAVVIMLAAAAGDVTEAELVTWINTHARVP